jgi:hypothetical protein
VRGAWWRGIPELTPAKRLDFLVLSGAFRTAIPRCVVIVAVLIPLLICIVVLVVVADEIIQREAIMSSDKIDARVGSLPITLV